MPQINFDLKEEVDKIVLEYSKKWKLKKSDTIENIILEFKKLKEKEDGNVR